MQVFVGALDRHAAHRNIAAEMLAALGQHDAERARGRFGVIEEQLVEIAHPVEQQAVRIGRFDLDILLHHRGDAAQLVGRFGRHTRGVIRCHGGTAAGGLGLYLVGRDGACCVHAGDASKKMDVVPGRLARIHDLDFRQRSGVMV